MLCCCFLFKTKHKFLQKEPFITIYMLISLNNVFMGFLIVNEVLNNL